MDNGYAFLIFIAFPPSPLGFTLHFVIFAPDASIALVLAVSAVLFYDYNSFSCSYKNCALMTPMADICVTSVTETYERRLNSKPYVCTTKFGRATLGANGVPKRCFSRSCLATPMSASSS